MKDCYNSCCGRSSRPINKLVVKGKACWQLLYRSVYVAPDYSPNHDACHDMTSVIEMGLKSACCVGIATLETGRIQAFPLSWYYGRRQRKVKTIR